AQVVAEPGHAHRVTCRELMDDVAQLVLGLSRAQPPVDRLESFALGGDVGTREAAFYAIHGELDRVVLGNDGLEHEPPQLAQAARKAGGNVDGERGAMAIEDRIGETQVVAVSIVEGEGNEAAAESPADEPAVHLVETDDLDVGTAQPGHHRL